MRMERQGARREMTGEVGLKGGKRCEKGGEYDASK